MDGKPSAYGITASRMAGWVLPLAQRSYSTDDDSTSIHHLGSLKMAPILIRTTG